MHQDATEIDSTAWFALHVKPRREKSVARTLRTKGYEEFLPLFKTKRRWSDRVKEISKPLFPRYTFCRFDPNRRLPVLQTPGVLEVVGFGHGPQPVDPPQIEAIQAIVESGLPVEPFPSIEPGEKVRVMEGPLRGLEGVLQRYRDLDRLIVSMTLLQRSVAVEIERDWIRRV